QAGSQYGHDFLHGNSPYAGIGFVRKGLKVDGADRGEAVQVVIAEKVQKVTREPGVSPDGRGGESAYPSQVFAIGVNQPLQWRGRRGNQGTLLLEVFQQRLAEGISDLRGPALLLREACPE